MGRGPKVAIVGAGVSGLATCKQCCARGLDATVFEAKSEVGGVWTASYASTKLQTPKHAYAFADFPWPEAVPTFPSHRQVVDYLDCYAAHFGLHPRIRFNSLVVQVRKVVTTTRSSEESSEKMGGGWPWVGATDFLWEVGVRTKERGREEEPVIEWLTFDYLVMCCGQFGDVPNMPSFPVSHGPDVFNGIVLHSLHYSALDSLSTRKLLGGKKAVVVGFQKTAIDVAVEVADINQDVDGGQPCTMLFKRTHWMYPRHRQAFGLFSFGYMFATRYSEYWTPKPGQGFVQSALQGIFRPVRMFLWKMLEYYIRFTFPVAKFGLVPEHSLLEDLRGCILPQIPPSLVGHLEAGRIVPKKTPYWDFYAKGVRLADGAHIEADVVIFCTGYDGQSKLKAVIPEEYKYALFATEGVLSLYRGIIHPQIPRMAFVGYSEGLSSVHSSEMSAIWLAQLLRQEVTLPDVKAMERERRMLLQYVKSATRFHSRICVIGFQIWHVDKLCRDLGYSPRRKQSWFHEIFSIYGTADYKSLVPGAIRSPEAKPTLNGMVVS